MSPRPFFQLDVFADRPGAGNPLAVMLEADDLSTEAMQAFAQWTNLSETTFLLQPESPQADYRVRIFTPRSELSFAGHPSVGAAWIVAEARNRNASESTLVQECGAGLLPVRIENRAGALTAYVQSPTAGRCDVFTPEWLTADTIFGATRGELPPGLWDNGPGWWLIELADEEAVRTLTPDLSAIASLPSTVQSPGGKLAVFARCDRPDYQIVTRAFAPLLGVAEDPVTGSANACIATLLKRSDCFPGSNGSYIASQGRELRRDGRIEIIADGDEVWIGGQVQKVISGTVTWN